MKISDILSEIDSEIARLSQVREILIGSKNGSSPAPRKRHIVSAAARKRIGDVQRKRWAAQKRLSNSEK